MPNFIKLNKSHILYRVVCFEATLLKTRCRSTRRAALHETFQPIDDMENQDLSVIEIIEISIELSQKKMCVMRDRGRKFQHATFKFKMWNSVSKNIYLLLTP